MCQLMYAKSQLRAIQRNMDVPQHFAVLTMIAGHLHMDGI
jgi:hypothetical protein